MRRIRRRAAHKMVEQRHAHGEAVGHLLEHARLRPVRHARIDFETANHRPGCSTIASGFARRSRSGVS